MASTSAASSTRSPRAVLMMRTPRRHRDSRSRFRSPRVAAVDGRCRVMKSARSTRASNAISAMPRSSAICAAMKGSWATTAMSKASARRTTSRPMRPRPTTPRVLPRNSAPRRLFLHQRPAFICASAIATDRAEASIRAKTCSATLTLFAPGAFRTTMPRSLAASTSTLSTPAPARATTRRRGAPAISSAVTVVALRTMRASASVRAARSSVEERPVRASIVHPSASSRDTAGAGSGSGMTIFMSLEKDAAERATTLQYNGGRQRRRASSAAGEGNRTRMVQVAARDRRTRAALARRPILPQGFHGFC